MADTLSSAPSASDVSDTSAQSDSHSESGSDDEISTRNIRQRPKWRHVWNSQNNTDMSYDELMRSLPSCATVKNDLSKCTMDHVSMDQYELSHTIHKMRTILTKCTSARCALSEVKCGCRYKINKCQETDFITVAQEGVHCMESRFDTSSPPTSKGLTTEMKAVVHESIRQNFGITPHVVFGRICNEIAGPPPLESQVQGYMKRWRGKNRDDSMEPVIDICAKSMFGLVPNVDQSGGNLLVFCDSTWHNNKLIPNIGNASDSSPFRMGLTSYTLLEQYVTIQQDPRCVTILHVDSTHSMVRQRYNVFILGVSDSCGRFFPVVYYCASQRRAEDVAWCLNYLKRVMLRVFAVSFAPQYIMTDADKAQYSACTTEVPGTKILMCWFHVCQHAWKKSKKLSKFKRDLIFRGLNDLHFCRTQVEFEIKKVNIINEWTTIGQTCQRFRIVSKKLIRQWLDNPRFSNWQSFHTPPGYATTNNPVEQYHRTLKLGNSSHATPFEMVKLLDRSRLAFQANKLKFSSITEASKRLKSHYNKIKKQGQLQSRALLRVGDLQHQLVIVKHVIPGLHHGIGPDNVPIGSSHEQVSSSTLGLTIPKKAKKKSKFYAEDVAQPIKSYDTLRMQWEGMPTDGWVVDATTRACQCRFHGKYNICPHIIEATKLVGAACPGYKQQPRRFESRDTRSKQKTLRLTQLNAGSEASSCVINGDGANSVGIVHLQRNENHSLSNENQATTTSEFEGDTILQNFCASEDHTVEAPTIYRGGPTSELLYVPDLVRYPVVPTIAEDIPSTEHAPLSVGTPLESNLTISQQTGFEGFDQPIRISEQQHYSFSAPKRPSDAAPSNRQSCEHTKRRRG